VAHGSDGAGSIRIPSALCGIVGLKPTLGLVPQVPSDNWSAIGHSGPMTRTVRDAALLLGAMAGYDPRDPYSFPQAPTDYLAACEGDLKGVRLVYSADFGYATVEPEVRAAATAAARRFADLGCELEERDPGWENLVEAERILYWVFTAAEYGRYLDERPEWIEDTLKAMI
jgi:Asp-tRNA(Asn)/Glu-tRNA(Gln) amidotransferase A subunit family amidase